VTRGGAPTTFERRRLGGRRRTGGGLTAMRGDNGDVTAVGGQGAAAGDRRWVDDKAGRRHHLTCKWRGRQVGPERWVAGGEGEVERMSELGVRG
jgi:hypothetical protein